MQPSHGTVCVMLFEILDPPSGLFDIPGVLLNRHLNRIRVLNDVGRAVAFHLCCLRPVMIQNGSSATFKLCCALRCGC